MTKTLRLGSLSKSHIKAIVGQIGPRAAGSAAEKKTRDYIEQELKKCGYYPEYQTIRFSPFAQFEVLPFISALSLVLAGLFFDIIPGLAILLPLYFALLPNLSHFLIKCRPKRSISENLFAFTENETDKPTLIFCSHIDTAPVFRVKSNVVLRLYNQSMYILQRMAIFISILSGLIILNLPVPKWLVVVCGSLSVIIGSLYFFAYVFNAYRNNHNFSNGAVDNASGVGVNLALAKYYSQNSCPRLRLGFLFTSAEETGMHGARDFSKLVKNKEHPVAVLNLDMVGRGKQIFLVNQVGYLFPVKTDQRLKEVFRDAFPAVKEIRYSLRGGDFLPFCQERIPAISIETHDDSGFDFFYHTDNDNLEIIQEETLDMVAEAVVDFVNLFQYSDLALSQKK